MRRNEETGLKGLRSDPHEPGTDTPIQYETCTHPVPTQKYTHLGVGDVVDEHADVRAAVEGLPQRLELLLARRVPNLYMGVYIYVCDVVWCACIYVS